jgi:hypothetical protein
MAARFSSKLMKRRSTPKLGSRKRTVQQVAELTEPNVATAETSVEDALERLVRVNVGAFSASCVNLAILVNAPIQVVPLAQDLHVRLIHQPGRAHWLPAPTDLLGQSGPELLDPAQNGPPADVDAAISQDAGNALGRGAQLQVADGQQDDFTREAMAGHQACRLAGGVAATGTTGAYHMAALIVAVAAQVRG